MEYQEGKDLKDLAPTGARCVATFIWKAVHRKTRQILQILSIF
jgi:hypothetical protein